MLIVNYRHAKIKVLIIICTPLFMYGCSRDNLEKAVDSFKSAKNEYDLLNIPASYIDVILKNPTNIDFSKPRGCTAYHSNAISTPWRDKAITAENVGYIKDIYLIRELSQLKETCDLGTKRAKTIEVEVKKRNLLTVSDIHHLSAF